MHKPIPDQVLSQHVAILGKTRSGKTNSAKLAIEQVAAAGSRVCIIDPIKADYWGLTSSADGKKPGLPFHIIGGAHGHVPLHAGAGAAIAEVVASGALRLSIIDMEQFGPRESSPFFAAFMEAIFKKIVGVLYLVIDEAHLFAPKEGRGDESMATYWFKRMASGSGSKGVRLIVSTQRVQELHNTVLSNCDTVIAHRVTFPEDQKRISDWVASHASKDVLAEVKRSLPNLQRGEAWICSGEVGIFERRQLPLCSTYDNSRTPTEDDQRREVKTAQIDQAALRGIIGEAVKEAEANDPKLLRAKIADLERKFDKSARTVQTDPAAIEKARVEGAKARDKEWEPIVKSLERWNRDLVGRMGNAERTAAELAALLHVNGEAPKTELPRAPSIETAAVRAQRGANTPDRRGGLQSPGQSGLMAKASRPAHERLAPAHAKVTRTPLGSPALADSQLGKCERAILQVLAQHPDGCRSGKLTLLVGYRFSGGFRNSLAALRTGGLIEGENSGTMRLTEAGLECGPFDPLPEGQDLIDYWLRHPSLSKCAREILSTLINSPEGATAEELCQATGYEFSGGFRNALSDLRTAGLIVGANRERMRAAETLLG